MLTRKEWAYSECNEYKRHTGKSAHKSLLLHFKSIDNTRIICRPTRNRRLNLPFNSRMIRLREVINFIGFEIESGGGATTASVAFLWAFLSRSWYNTIAREIERVRDLYVHAGVITVFDAMKKWNHRAALKQ